MCHEAAPSNQQAVTTSLAACTTQVVILVTSILSTSIVLDSLPLMRLKRSTLIVDVLSVKVGTGRSLAYPCSLIP